MKLPIAWHEECLANLRISLERQKEEVARLVERVAHTKLIEAQMVAQIDEAKRRGLTEFDAERLMKRRRAA